jgi:hypothetical protein
MSSDKVLAKKQEGVLDMSGERKWSHAGSDTYIPNGKNLSPPMISRIANDLICSKAHTINMTGVTLSRPESFNALLKVVKTSSLITNVILDHTGLSEDRKNELRKAVKNTSKTPAAKHAYQEACQKELAIRASYTLDVLTTLKHMLQGDTCYYRLNLRYHHIRTPEKIQTLGSALAGSQVKSIDLQHTDLSGSGCQEAMFELVKSNTNITHGHC